MSRFLLFLFVVFISGIFLQGKYLQVNHSYNISVSDSSYTVWKEKLTDSCGIPDPAIHLALNSFFELQSKSLIQNDSILTIIDFSKPSYEKRLFVLDLKNKKIIKNTMVAHGINTGLVMAESFSNNRHSNKSSLGLFITLDTYEGKHGYSLRIEGLSKGINDNAYKRDIVIHGADYVSEEFLNKNGRIGRSFGCPAIPIDETKEIIDLIKNGSCLYIYHPSLIPISQTDLEKFQ